MPNGKPGDHWYTDITEGLPTFSREVDALLLSLDREAAAGRDYTPWDDARRQRIEAVVEGLLDEVGHEELASRSETIGMSYRNLSDGELRELRRRLENLRDSV
jgi:hypothetical protein